MLTNHLPKLGIITCPSEPNRCWMGILNGEATYVMVSHLPYVAVVTIGSKISPHHTWQASSPARRRDCLAPRSEGIRRATKHSYRSNYISPSARQAPRVSDLVSRVRSTPAYSNIMVGP